MFLASLTDTRDGFSHLAAEITAVYPPPLPLLPHTHTLISQASLKAADD